MINHKTIPTSIQTSTDVLARSYRKYRLQIRIYVDYSFGAETSVCIGPT
jgi:hypothetical protein